MDTVILRPCRKSDENFIINSWLKSVRNNLEFQPILNDIYFKEQAEVIIKLIGRGCTVLCEADDPEHIYGYIVYDQEKKEVHFCYLKFSYRKLPTNMAKKLFELLDESYVATTFSKKNKWKYNPFLRYK